MECSQGRNESDRAATRAAGIGTRICPADSGFFVPALGTSRYYRLGTGVLRLCREHPGNARETNLRLTLYQRVRVLDRPEDRDHDPVGPNQRRFRSVRAWGRGNQSPALTFASFRGGFVCERQRQGTLAESRVWCGLDLTFAMRARRDAVANVRSATPVRFRPGCATAA